MHLNAKYIPQKLLPNFAIIVAQFCDVMQICDNVVTKIFCFKTRLNFPANNQTLHPSTQFAIIIIQVNNFKQNTFYILANIERPIICPA